MRKYKIYLSNKNTDWLYKNLIEMLMKFSDIDESDIVERKDNWNEYEDWEGGYYIIECELSEKEYVHLLKNFKVDELKE
ncbi:hypothetical protein [uncultured Clostridium sp.]|uniref:hypothetical protein n=1 Tax=uncultured Clostridium sp. TaxID=59620 RepID=UPI003217D79F